MKRHLACLLIAALLMGTFVLPAAAAEQEATTAVTESVADAIVEETDEAIPTEVSQEEETGIDQTGQGVAELAPVGSKDFAYNAPQITALADHTDGSGVSGYVDSMTNGEFSLMIFRKTDGGEWAEIRDGVRPCYGVYVPFTDPDVELGKTYTYAARLYDPEKEEYLSDYSEEKSYTYLPAPMIGDFSNTASGAKLTWSPIDGAEKYQVLYRASMDTSSYLEWSELGTTSDTALIDTTVSDGEKRVYTVRALDSADNAVGSLADDFGDAWSNIFYAPPVISSISNTGDGVELSLDVSKREEFSDDTFYLIYRKTTGAWQRIAEIEPQGGYVDRTVTSGTKYTYTYRFAKRVGDTGSYKMLSAYLDGKSITASQVDYPAVTAFSDTVSGVKLTWNAYPNAKKYRVFHKTPSGWKTLATVSGTSYTDSAIKKEAEAADTGVTAYLYTVRALDAQNRFISDYHRGGWLHEYVCAPEISVLSVSKKGVEIRWNRADFSEADTYYVYRKTASASWKLISGSRGEDYIVDGGYGYTDTTAKLDTKYTYTLRRRTVTLSPFLAGKSIPYCSAPTLVSVSAVKNGAAIKWKAVSSAPKYRVFVSVNGSWKKLGDTAAASYVHTGLANDTDYTYTVRCLNTDGRFCSNYDTTGITIHYYLPPTITSAAKGKITWKRVPTAASYRVYRKEFGKSWEIIGSSTGTSYTDSTFLKDVPYTYTVRAMDKGSKAITHYNENNLYYNNGALANGKVNALKTTLIFKNGKFVPGFYRKNNRTYYYNANGIIRKNGIVGSSTAGYTYADKNGVCCTSEEIKLAAEFIMKHAKGKTMEEKMKTSFLYLAHEFPYNRTYGDQPKKPADIAPLAIDMFKNERGNCFRYAGCFACVARICGYRVRFVNGLAGVYYPPLSPHGWTEVYYNGKWRICDPDYQIPSWDLPDYKAYMMDKHDWYLDPYWRSELTIVDGKAVWN